MNRRDAIKALAAIPFAPAIPSTDASAHSPMQSSGRYVWANCFGGTTCEVDIANIADCPGFGPIAYGYFVVTGMKCCLMKNEAENTWWVVAEEA